MPKNKTGGSKHKKMASKHANVVQRKLIFKEHDQSYAKVIKRLGGNFLKIQLEDNTEVLGRIRGKLFKRGWMSPDDIILVSLRPDDTISKNVKKKVDIIHKYNSNEVRNLLNYGEINQSLIKGKRNNNDENNNIAFEDVFDFESI